jgi:SanA protein
MPRMYRAIEIFVITCLVLLLGAMLAPLLMRLAVSSDIYTLADDVPQAEVAIIPGASVYERQPSPVLAERANAAVELYMKGKVAKILVTGDNGALSHDEVSPVRRYLLDAGVKPQDIFVDHAGFDTYSSMFRAVAVFHATSAIIVTQDFHLPRAVFIARALGINAYGFLALGQGNAYDYMREVPASDKALLDLLSHRQPKFLGMPYPITGDGQATWY